MSSACPLLDVDFCLGGTLWSGDVKGDVTSLTWLLCGRDGRGGFEVQQFSERKERRFEI